jgi:threonine/homoserine/homoserine lactone efflux protein
MGRARGNGVLDYLPPDPEGDFVEWISTVGIGISVVAGIISYSRHRSVPWAIAHGWAGAPYLVYLGYKAVVDKQPVLPAASPDVIEAEEVVWAEPSTS